MSARSTVTLHQEVRMKIVLDLGNVTVYFKPVEYLRGLGYDEARIPELKHAIFDSQPWLDCDAGTLDRAAEIEAMCAQAPALESDIRAIMARCDEMLQPIPNSVRALERLTREGFECYYLSNTNEPALKFISGFEYFKAFSGGIASYAERLAKPDLAIFDAFAKRYAAAPAECVFIDDNPKNVEAARRAGFNALVLSDPDGLYDLVDALLREYRLARP